MQLLECTLPTAAGNVALDEALLCEAEDAGPDAEVLRLWESPQLMVVLGRSSKAREEARLDVCRRLGAPVVRRSSGGGAILAGPGCLMYAVVLSLEKRPALRAIDQAHRFVLRRIAAALQPLCDAAPGGTSDLVLGDRKVSGNSMRRRRTHLLYHGTLLYDLPLERVGEFLSPPPRQPAYRGGRDHASFLANLPLKAPQLRDALRRAWQADEVRAAWPTERVRRLVAQRYGNDAWMLRH